LRSLARRWVAVRMIWISHFGMPFPPADAGGKTGYARGHKGCGKVRA
jgi:hypothetical protein